MKTIFKMGTKDLCKLRESISAIGRAGRMAGMVGQRLGLCYQLAGIQGKIRYIYRYELPIFTIRDHLKDCYGWLTEAQP